MLPPLLPLLLVLLFALLLVFPLLAVAGGGGRGGAVRVGGGGVLQELLQLLDPCFFFIAFVFSDQVVHWVFVCHSELLQFLVSFDEEGTLSVPCPVSIALASPTLHHFHLLPQRHPQPLGGGVSQEVPSILISWISRNTVLWFVLLRLYESRRRFFITA